MTVLGQSSGSYIVLVEVTLLKVIIFKNRVGFVTA